MKKRKLYLGIGLLCLFLLGCAKEKMVIESQGNFLFDQESNSEEKEELEGERAEIQEPPTTAVTMGEGTEENEAETEKKEEAIWVHICGEVALPGVYQFPEGARIWDALQKAGGVTDAAQADYLNQASLLADGMKITVPSKEQALMWETNGESGVQRGQESSLVQTDSPGGPAKETGKEEGNKVNINTADEAALCTLPGIGASRAKSIIAYRQGNGPFAQIEDIMKVTGIKEAAFARIKDCICVS